MFQQGIFQVGTVLDRETFYFIHFTTIHHKCDL